jgi:8-oxo-dGTP pyrophosphatase MutT (NUDIX family)
MKIFVAKYHDLEQVKAAFENGEINYYKFPGGGIEADECMEDALIREVSEETGLCEHISRPPLRRQ